MGHIIVQTSGGLTSANDKNPYARAKHARYFENGVPYHTISRTHGNLFLFKPDGEGMLRKTLAGILAEAKTNWPNVLNFATVLLSNHLHALLEALYGDPRAISDYIGFVKRELTRRWAREIGWSGSTWEGYKATAIITPKAQIHALAYVIGQGCKENLVSDPRQWPGFHCAESLVTGEPVKGHWLDGTEYGKDLHAQKPKKNPLQILREDYFKPRDFSFDKLPALDDLDDAEYRAKMLELVKLAVTLRDQQHDCPPLGPEAVCEANLFESRPVPKPPWFEERKRMIVWDNPCAPEVHAYLDRYWEHQVQFRVASKAWRKTEPDTTEGRFPENCFVPGLRPRPISHMEQGTG